MKKERKKTTQAQRKGQFQGPLAFVEIGNSWERDFLKKKLQGRKDLLFFPQTADQVLDEIQKACVLSVFIKSKVTPRLLAKMPNLKLITTRSTGYDHIDLEAARKKGIPVANVPTYGENTVAEHTFALILSLSRNLRKAYLRTLQNDFSLKGLMGSDLKHKTLGVVGTGHIGLHVIRIGVGFGMKVIASDVKQNHFLSEVLNFRYVPFDRLLKQSDIITLHVPYLPSTHHLINKDNIGYIKKGAILINTSRGGLIETDALIRALEEGRLAGAGLDVLEEEEFLFEEYRFLEDARVRRHWDRLQTILANRVLLNRENVVYTPHMAFFSRQAVERILETTVENIEAFLNQQPLINQVV